ncbi:putative exonuclease RecB type protein [Synechococcus phage Ssp-JY38]|nr:hypothetical protein [Synechococcus phage Yong-L2-223]
MPFDNPIGYALRDTIDGEIKRLQRAGESTNDVRHHLGASVVGDECARARWYAFRWATKVEFEGRILRLFDRGHKEEPRFFEWLDMVGAEIRAHAQQLLWHPESDSYVVEEWDVEYSVELVDVTDILMHRQRAEKQGIKVRQWGFVADDGHFAGSGDAKGRHIPGQEHFVPWDEWILVECKTHNDKSFKGLVEHGVQRGKSEHYHQVQHYMSRLGLRLCCYLGVNKNDDELYPEFIPLDPAFAPSKEHEIREAIYSPRPPKRISAHPTWYKCKWCDHRPTCHFGEPMRKSCRTCVMAQPIDAGQWKCHRWGKTIPKAAQIDGCGHWQQIEG